MSSNFRHHLLSLSLLVGITAPGPLLLRRQSVVSAQARSKTASLNSSVFLTLTVSFNPTSATASDNQNDIDSLRGQIQESQYQLNQVVERQKQILLQIDGHRRRWAAAGAQPSPSAGDQGAAAAAAPAASSGAPALDRRCQY